MTVKTRSPQKQEVHQLLIEKVVIHFWREGYMIAADHEDYRSELLRPIKGYTPDIIALKDKEDWFVIEVETLETYNTTHARDQLTAFHKFGPTILVIPSLLWFQQQYDSKSDIFDLLREWGLNDIQVAICDPLEGDFKFIEPIISH